MCSFCTFVWLGFEIWTDRRMFLHFVFIILYLFFRDIGSTEYMAYAFVLHCILGIFLYSRKSKQILSPIIIYYITTALATVGNMVVEHNVELGENQSYAYMVKRYVPDANLIWCIGCAFIFIGYEVFSKYSYAKIDFRLSKVNAKRFFAITVVMSILYPFIYQSLSFLGSLNKLIYLAGTVGILFFSRLWAIEKSVLYRSYVIMLYIVQTYVAIRTSYLRFELIVPAIVLFMGFMVGKGKLKSIVSAEMMPFIVVFILFVNMFGTLGKYRADFYDYFVTEYLDDKGQAQTDYTDISSDERMESLDLLEEEDVQQSLIERISVVAQISNIVQLTEDKGFYDGLASAPLITALVPRILWPEKPMIRMGAWFALEIGVAINDYGAVNNSINMTIPGEMYLDFGWFGVVLGCIVFGGLISMFWNSVNFYESPYNILGTLIGGYILLFSFYGPAGDMQILVTYMSVYFMFLFLHILLPKIITKNINPVLS